MKVVSLDEFKKQRTEKAFEQAQKELQNQYNIHEELSKIRTKYEKQ